jgi:hypothetical protein
VPELTGLSIVLLISQGFPQSNERPYRWRPLNSRAASTLAGDSEQRFIADNCPYSRSLAFARTLAAGEDRMDRVGKAVGKDAAMSRYERDIRQALKVGFDAGCLREAGAAEDCLSLAGHNLSRERVEDRLDPSSGCNRMR